MLVWIAHMIQIAVVGFVGYCIVAAVNNKLISQMIILVALIIAIQTTIFDVTPTIERIHTKVDSIQNSIDSVTRFIP